MAPRLGPIPLICPTKVLIEITGEGTPEILDSPALLNYRAQRLQQENGARERTDNVSAKIDCWDEREESGAPTVIAQGEEGEGKSRSFEMI